ncbi:Uncharacterized protein QTN25_008782 [Entamoeba marina]
MPFPLFCLFLSFSLARDCTCTVNQHELLNSYCNDDKEPESDCTFIIENELDESIELISCHKLIISQPNSLYVESGIIIDEMVVESNIELSGNDIGSIQIKKLTTTNTPTLELSITTEIEQAEGDYSLNVYENNRAFVSGNIQKVELEGRLISKDCKIDHLLVNEESEVTLQKNTYINTIQLRTSNFHLFAEDIPQDFLISNYIIDMDIDKIVSIPLFHYANPIKSKLISTIQDINNKELNGTISKYCSDTELFYVTNPTTQILCEPLLCIYEKGKFNSKNCPYPMSQNNNEEIPSILLLKDSYWESSWGNIPLTTIEIDCGPNSFTLSNLVNAQNIIISSGEVTLKNLNLKNVEVKPDGFANFIDISVDSLTARDSQVVVENIKTNKLIDIDGAIFTLDGNVECADPTAIYLSNSEIIFKNLSKFYIKSKLTTFLNELTITSNINNFPVFIGSPAIFQIGSNIAITDIQDRCVELVLSNCIDGIVLEDSTSVDVDKNSISAFVCKNSFENLNAFIHCPIPKELIKSKIIFEEIEQEASKTCGGVEPYLLNYDFGDNEILIEFKEIPTIGKISARTLTTTSNSTYVSITEIHAQTVNVKSQMEVDTLNLMNNNFVNVFKQFQVSYLRFETRARFTVEPLSSIEFYTFELKKVDVLLKESAKMLYHCEGDFSLMDCGFSLSKTSAVQFDGNLIATDAIFNIDSPAENALCFESINFDRMRVNLISKNEDDAKKIDENTLYLIMAEEVISKNLPSIAIVNGLKSTATPVITCDGQWIIINDKDVVSCPESPYNLNGKEVVVVPSHWRREKKTASFLYIIIGVPIIIILIFIVFKMAKTRTQTTTHDSNYSD